MFDSSNWQRGDQETERVGEEPKPRTIEEIDLTEIQGRPVAKFVAAFLVGFVFFLVPVPWEGQVTVPFDIVVSWITDSFPTIAGVYALALIVAGGLLTTAA